MKYVFVLGHNPTLSVAEILSVLDALRTDYTIISLSNEALVIDTEKIIEKEPGFINRLGGVIKIAKVLTEKENTGAMVDIFQDDEGFDYLRNFIERTEPSTSKKLHWGISVYFLSDQDHSYKKEAFKDVQGSLFKAKREFTGEKKSIRIIIPAKGRASLDSASVFNNKIIEKGGEIMVLVDLKKIYLAKTIVIQDFESYGLRDYGRPARDMKVGMMPPKLAQIMINLAQVKKGDTVLDPFCGTGVVLQEALLMGYKAIGSDIIDKILEYSTKNLKWLGENFKLGDTKYEIFKRDARDVSKIVANGSIGGIVTEGTLGPKYANKGPNSQEMQYNFKQLELLYVSAFNEFAKVLKKDAKIVITFPFYRLNEENIALTPFIDKILAAGYNILCPIKIDEIKKHPAIQLTARDTILYDRPNQMVGREVVIFSKK